MTRQNDCIPLVCTPPEEQLINAVRDNDLDKIRCLIDDNSFLLTHRYADYHNKSILEIICAEDLSEVTPETVRLLIHLGADLEQPNNFFNDMRVIHFAAEAMNIPILAEVLDGMQMKQINFNLITSHGDTALIYLLKNGDTDNKELFEKCVKLMAEKVDVNCVDNKGKPAVFIAAKEGMRYIVNILKSYKLDVDSYQDLRSKKTARDLIIEHSWYSSNDFPPYCYNEDAALVYKINNNELTEQDLMTLSDVNKEYHNGTLLQMLVQRSMVGLVEKLMANLELDCNKTTTRNKTRPIDIAVERGDYVMLDVLLRNPKTSIPDNLLCQALTNFDRVAFPGRDYKQCVHVCLQDKRVQNLLNKPGDRGNYPLHFACRYADEKTILSLLQKKASLANRSTSDYLTMNDIRKRTLEIHLDSCLSIHKSEPVSHHDEKEIRFDFTTLLPTVGESTDSKIDIPAENGNSGYQEINTKLLTDRIDKNEMDMPIFMSQSAELKPLLTHPILAMFINLKWQEVSRIHLFNLGFYIILCFFLYIHIFLNYINEDYETYGGGIKTLLTVFYAINIFCLIALVLREFFQLWLERWRYFHVRNIENYIELILIITMIIIVLEPILDDTYSLRKQVASITILFSGIDLFLLIGKNPKLSTNTVILRSVSLAFLKLLIWYFILIGAFALSFYTLFSGEKQEEGDDPNFFINPALAAIKTIIMLTGEFDAGSIKFDSIPVISHIIFLMFVFMISIVLFNLMNGLAVTDTQMIKSKSELYSYVSQVQYIAYIEKLRTNHKLKDYMKKLFKPSFFEGDGQHVMTVPLHQDGKWRGQFKRSMSEQVEVRQSLVKRAKVVVEERKIERQGKIAQDKEEHRLEQMERMMQEISKKIEALSKKDNDS